MTIPVKFSLSNICVKYTGKLISRNGIFRDFMLAVKRVHVRTYIGTTCTQLSVHAHSSSLAYLPSLIVTARVTIKYSFCGECYT